jgi:hypothetical protein
VGLKLVPFGPNKVGKTVFGLTMAEVGPIGVIDTEGRHQWYTLPLVDAPKRPFPYDNPRRVRPDLDMLRANPTLQAAFASAHPIYLVQTVDLEKTRLATKAWNNDADIVGIDLDSGSITWDMLMSTRDDSDERKAMLSWGPVKAWDKLYKIGLTGGNKHVIILAHAQEKLKMVKRPDGSNEFITEKIVPRLEKYSGHWADMVVTFDYPEGAKFPTLIVIDEGTGGAGGLRRGAKMPDPTFKKLLDRLGWIPATAQEVTAEQTDIAYRNKCETEKAASTQRK